jgi:hypothetical protein
MCGKGIFDGIRSSASSIIFVLIYFLGNAPLCAEETLSERLTDPKDWIVGFFGGLAVVLVLSRRVPHLRINKSIVERKGDTKCGIRTGPPRPTIQVLNKRRYWWIFSGDAIDIRAELRVVTYSGHGREVVRRIDLVRSDPLIVPHKRRFGSSQGDSEYLFDVKNKSASDLRKELIEAESIRFRLYARDSFSNYSKVFTRYYRNRDRSKIATDCR